MATMYVFFLERPIQLEVDMQQLETRYLPVDNILHFPVLLGPH